MSQIQQLQDIMKILRLVETEADTNFNKGG